GEREEAARLLGARVERDDQAARAEPDGLRDAERRREPRELPEQDLAAAYGLREEERQRLAGRRDARHAEEQSRQRHDEEHEVQEAQRHAREAGEARLLALREPEVGEREHEQREQRGEREEPARLERAPVLLARNDADPAERDGDRRRHHRWPSTR